MDCSPPGSSVHGDYPGKNIEVGCCSLLQRVFPTQGLDSCLLLLLHWQADSLPLVPPGNPLKSYSSVQFSRSVVSDSLRPHESQHTRPPCLSPTPGLHSNSCPSSQWCHIAISSSVVPFSFPQHQSLFQWVNSSHEVAKVLQFQL